MGSIDMKVAWEGEVISVQPRIRLTRSIDQRSHTYLGYVLRVRGVLGGVLGEFTIALGKSAQEKNQFQVGDRVQGAGERVVDERLETAGVYKASGLKVVQRAGPVLPAPPPFLGVAPALEVYRGRGHRRLDEETYFAKCVPCIWGAEMIVEVITDQWDPSSVRYRRETFCYGPKSCPFYEAGPTRKVPGREGESWEEEDRVDADATEKRGPDE